MYLLKRITWLLLLITSVAVQAEVSSFYEAKKLAREQVYSDRNDVDRGTFYCGCSWEWAGRSGGVTKLESCGYSVRKQAHRAARTEWEHVLPAWSMGHQRQCWQVGGRENCTDNDLVFAMMEADLHNLVPTIGEANADRSHYRFGLLPGAPAQHGQCEIRVDHKSRIFQPPEVARGQIARIYFYMHDRYNLKMSRQQQQLMIAWNQQYPVSKWERERDKRIAAIMGHHNPFVTGEKIWQLGHKNGGEGLFTSLPAAAPSEGSVRGNRNSRVYHLSEGCPSYDRVSVRNRIEFSSVAEAEAAGYRRAGNCR